MRVRTGRFTGTHHVVKYIFVFLLTDFNKSIGCPPLGPETHSFRGYRKDNCGTLGHALSTVGHRKVRQALSPRRVLLRKVDLAFSAELGAPQSYTALQGA